MDSHDPSDQVRAHVAAAVAKLKSISESVGPLDKEKDHAGVSRGGGGAWTSHCCSGQIAKSAAWRLVSSMTSPTIAQWWRATGVLTAARIRTSPATVHSESLSGRTATGH